MDHVQVVGHKVVLLMKQTRHVLPKGRAPMPHVYKVSRYDQPCIAQKLILHHQVPHHRAYSKKQQEGKTESSITFYQTFAGRGVLHGRRRHAGGGGYLTADRSGVDDNIVQGGQVRGWGCKHPTMSAWWPERYNAGVRRRRCGCRAKGSRGGAEEKWSGSIV
jgi:hypothetical protein